MKKFPYLVAIAMIENEKGIRSMPLGGKSIKIDLSNTNKVWIDAKLISLDLLVRVLQKSESGLIKSSAGDESLLLIEIEMSVMQDILPKIKAEWINSGDKISFIKSLKLNCFRIWKVVYQRYEGLKFIEIS